MRYITLIILIILATIIILSDAVISSIMIYPTRIEKRLGSRVHQEQIFVTNSTDDALCCVVTVMDGGHDVNGRPFLSGLYPEGLVSVFPKEFSLAPGESISIDVTVSSGDEARGLLSPVIVFDLVPRPCVDETNGIIMGGLRVAVITLFTLPGEHEIQGKIRDVSVWQTSDGRALEFAVLVENLGNVHLRPIGEVRVTKEGSELCRLMVNNGVILPGFARILKTRWNPKELLVGTYAAQALLTLDDGEKVIADVCFDIPVIETGDDGYTSDKSEAIRRLPTTRLEIIE